MAIRIRRGNQVDFDPNKLVPGELGLVLDAGELYFCYSAGNTKKLTTKEDVQAILNSSPDAYTALQQCITDLNNNPSELTNILNNISTLQSGKLDKVGDSKDNIVTFTEALIEEDIATGEVHSTLFGKILNFMKTIRTGKINTSDIIHTTAVNNTSKIPSSAVTYSLAQSVQTLSDNLTSSSVNDLNFTLTTNREAVNYFSSSTLNKPSTFTAGGIVRTVKYEGIHIQTAYNREGTSIALRNNINGTWSAWTIK